MREKASEEAFSIVQRVTRLRVITPEGVTLSTTY
jgi:hypothetical protein